MAIPKANSWQLILFNFINPDFLFDIFNVKYFLIFNLRELSDKSKYTGNLIIRVPINIFLFF